MERVSTINPERIAWCCADRGISIEELARDLKIAPSTLTRAMKGSGGLTVNQLNKIAEHFNRGLLFFLDEGPVREQLIHTPQFRTLTNQKPDLSPKLKALIERVEKQREIYLSLIEDLGEEVPATWGPPQLHASGRTIKAKAAVVRTWLGLGETNTFQQYRQAVESAGILVFVSNGYQGRWQIAKDSPVRGFSLYYDKLPVIVIKKQTTEGPQAFTLMHELGHLLLHKNSFVLICTEI